MPKTIQGAADYLVQRLKAEGFKIQRYDAYSTQSVYLKLDYGVGNSVRISDHMGKKHLQYRFNLIKQMGTKYMPPKPGRYPRYFYSFTKIEDMVTDIVAARDEKLALYGRARYEAFMDKNKADNSEARGFWAQCVEV